MSTFTFPAELSTLLGQLKDRTELRDTSGSLLGVFTPQASIGARQDAARRPTSERGATGEKKLAALRTP